MKTEWQSVIKAVLSGFCRSTGELAQDFGLPNVLASIVPRLTRTYQ